MLKSVLKSPLKLVVLGNILLTLIIFYLTVIWGVAFHRKAMYRNFEMYPTEVGILGIETDDYNTVFQLELINFLIWTILATLVYWLIVWVIAKAIHSMKPQ